MGVTFGRRSAIGKLSQLGKLDLPLIDPFTITISAVQLRKTPNRHVCKTERVVFCGSTLVD
jgi:hypothetical protein